MTTALHISTQGVDAYSDNAMRSGIDFVRDNAIRLQGSAPDAAVVLSNVGAPSADSDAANKEYADDAARNRNIKMSRWSLAVDRDALFKPVVSPLTTTVGYDTGNLVSSSNPNNMDNTAIGHRALPCIDQNQTLHQLHGNVCVGAYAGYNIQDGIHNTIVGYASGTRYPVPMESNASYNTIVGAAAANCPVFSGDVRHPKTARHLQHVHRLLDWRIYRQRGPKRLSRCVVEP